MNLKKLIEEGTQKFNIELSSEQIDKFLKYKDLIIEWNHRINLTAITEPSEIIEKHFIDSLACLISNKFYEGCKVIDVGTGAGLPGIPLKIARTDINVTLLDSLNKRINFLNEVIKELDLLEIKALHARAEDYGKDETFREQFDIAVSRAVANLAVLAEYVLPFVKIGGYFISLKGPEVDDEIQNGNKAINILGGKIEETIKIALPNSGIVHSLILIKKINKCPTKYPRKAGKPSKNPL